VARRLDLRVGDVVTADVAMPDGAHRVRGTLSGIYGPTGLLKDTVTLPSDDVAAALSANGMAPWTDAFLFCESPDALASEIARGPDADRLLAVPRNDLAQEARTRLFREVGPFLRSGATWVALAGFVGLVLWQQSARLRRRRSEYAVLSALGADRNTLMGLDSLEQALRLGLVIAIGTAGGLAVMRDLNGAYVPAETLVVTLAALIAVGVATVMVGAWSVSRNLTRRPLSDALAKGLS
jgi:hypothetical protein